LQHCLWERRPRRDHWRQSKSLSFQDYQKFNTWNAKVMNQKTAKTDLFKALTWDDLNNWAGTTIVERGKNYQHSRYVNNLAFSPNGELLAWVDGRERYTTLVDIEDGPHLQAQCTCPYWSNCKHAVAVVLEYLEQVRSHKEIPVASEQDPRLQPLQKPLKRSADISGPVDLPIAHASEALSAYLEQQTKAQLIELIKTLARHYSEVNEYLRDHCSLATGDTKGMLATAEAEISNLDANIDWDEEEDFSVNFSRLREQLEALLAHGRADQVLALGEQLLETGTRRVEHEEEGESTYGISRCMKVVFQALPQSSLSTVEQMCWVVDMQLEDNYDLCTEAVKAFWQREFPSSTWSELADSLQQRLEALPLPGKDDFTGCFRRDALSNRIIKALEHAGREAEILLLCEREAERTDSYTRLVNRLQAAGQLEAAKRWIDTGIVATREGKPGIASQLRDIWREIREQANDWPQVAAMAAEDFFLAPSLDSYQALQQAAEKAGVWPSVKAIALEYLQTGKPYQEAQEPSWPLPAPVVAPLSTRGLARASLFPNLPTLIDIAIAEKQPAQVLHWYDRQRADRVKQTGWGWFGGQDDRVADAVADDFPDRAIGIWRKLAELQIAQTQPKAYQQAAVYLRKIKPVLEKQERAKEWKELLQSLRKQHARKRKLIEILEQLEQGRILG
jgi:uncharacterized Zn finger protein